MSQNTIRRGATVLAAVMLAFMLAQAGAYAEDYANEPNFFNNQFANRWVEQDRLVGSAGISRFFTWGPQVAGAENLGREPYAESPNGMRQVEYFEKGRMELNQYLSPDATVTTGLLVRDLVTGQRQDGDNTFTGLPPSQTQVAGDDVSVNPDAPVYASFKNVLTFGTPDANSRSNTPGATINQFINKAGQISTFTPPESLTIGAYQPETGHNIAKVFEDFKNLRGPVINPLTGKRVENQPIYTSNPTVNVFGYAVSEPFWVRTKVAGVERLILVQLFQRRVLTYNMAINGQKVEMGNLGQHYYKWRYIENKDTAFPPLGIPAIGCLPASDASGNQVQGCVSNVAPGKGEDVTLYARLIAKGKVISGVAINSTWQFFNKTLNCASGPSGPNGVASCAINVGNDASNVTVSVYFSFDYNGQTYQNTLEFTPR